MKNYIQQPLTIVLFIGLILFAAPCHATRLEVQKDTTENTNLETSVVHGATVANLSIGFALATIVSDYIMTALYNLSSVKSPVVLLVSAVIGITSLILGFKALEKNRDFLRSGETITPAIKKRQKKVRKAAIAGITIGFFGTLLAIISIIANV